MHEQEGRGESDDLSLVRSLNNATRVLVGQKSHQTFSQGRGGGGTQTLTQFDPVLCERNYCRLKKKKKYIFLIIYKK